MLDITGNDIKELSDGDLRSLVGLLCEADFRSLGISSAGVTWGGHQNAPDGGIDVRVELSSPLSLNGFVPRSKTGFQVKKPDMPRLAILNEMRPNGELRHVIKELVKVSGAYIIVSSQGSTADSTLTSRKKAMYEAISDYPNASDIKLDFYDRNRIASWVRSHPSLVLWVRDKIGRQLQGWRTYGNWTNSLGGSEEQYMVDEKIRIYNNASSLLDGVSAIDGINEIRKILHNSGSSVRLVGLSGVGKTRLVQAFFDEQIGESPLNKSQVFYTDISDSPNPDPRSFAENLIAQQIPAILVIDNCPPELHKKLTSVCSASSSLVSLITVEYDVRDDYPEETDVFRLESSSDELVEKLIASRFSHVSQVDSRTISDFSGGNARIAIALANTIRQGENLGNLRDEELFTRLFQQRNGENQTLHRTAEVCSLVYSFDFQTAEGVNDELVLLSTLIGLSVEEIYLNVRNLQRRELVQQRGKWRAVLPHALANRLAVKALEDIPLEKILNVFEKGGSPRLLKSFSKRLSFLHECDEALAISRKWLSEDGLLGEVSLLKELEISLLRNIAPVNPELALSAISRVVNHGNAEIFFSRDNENYIEITRLLRSLAYDKNLFIQSVKLLYRFALSENPKENNNSIRSVLKSLFYLYLSGTHATPAQRLSIIAELIESENKDKIELGFSLLSSALESWHFNSHQDYEFGAHSRNYGYSPKNKEELTEWFHLYIEYTVSLAISDYPFAAQAQALLADKFRGLWIKAGMYNELEVASTLLRNKCFWLEGWIAVKATIRYDGEEMYPEVLSRLNNLTVILEPINLIERVKLYTLSGYQSSLDLADDIDLFDDTGSIDNYIKVENITHSLGQEVGEYEEILKELLPELLSSQGARLFSFGEGLAVGCSNPEKLWRELLEQMNLLDKGIRNFQLVRGFLKGTAHNDRNLAEKFLDMAIKDEVLAEIYPMLQCSIDINQQGVQRLKKSLEVGLAPISQYEYLSYGRIHETIDDEAICDLLRLIALEPDGISVAIRILYMRIHGNSEESIISEAIVSTGQLLVLNYQIRKRDNHERQLDYELSKIIMTCFKGTAAKESSRILCSRLLNAFESLHIYSRDYVEVLKAITLIQPLVFLDSFLNNVKLHSRVRRVFSDGINPLRYIDDDVIINWCKGNPNVRFPIAASVIRPYRQNEIQDRLEWTPLALEIIAHSYDSNEVLNHFKSSLSPNSWSGSLADIMEQRLCLITDLKNHDETSVAVWARQEEIVFKQGISSTRERELKWESERNESFE